MALVEMQGASALLKCMAVLRALGIPSFAIADLDFALTHAMHLPEPEALEPLLLEAEQQLATTFIAAIVLLVVVTNSVFRDLTRSTSRALHLPLI